MLKQIKFSLALIFIISAITTQVFAQEPCDKCKAKPDSCKLIQTGKCDNCNSEKKIVEKKIVVLSPDQDRGFLGVVTEKTDKGLTIKQVVPSSPAEKAGLKVDDIILEAKTKSVKTPDDLIAALKGTKPKDEITIKVKSKDEEKSLKIILAEVPKTATKITAMVSPEGESYEIEKEMKMPEMTCPNCGAKMPMPSMCPMMKEGVCPMMSGKEPMMMGKEMPMMKEMQKEFMVMPSKETRGFLGVVTVEEDGKLVVDQVVSNSPAEQVGIKEDDIIAEINGNKVTTPAGLIEELQGTKPGDIIHLKIISGSAEKMLDVALGEVPATSQPMMPQPMMPGMQMRMRMRGEGRGAGYFGPGFMFFDYDALNSVLVNHHLPALGKSQFVFGGGGWGQGNRIRIGGFGFGGVQTVSNDTLDVEVGYGAGFFEMGYNIVCAKHFMLTPIIGLGGSGLTMKITSLLYNPVNLDNVLSYPGGVAKVTTGGFSMFPGLTIDIPLSFAGLSFKGGYMWTPMKGSWIMEDYGKINGPALNLNGPFVMMNIMFGGGK
jgi:membrane-associated protease RseP (regulator of RpoE activity)